MDNGTIGSDRADRLERGALVVQVLSTVFIEDTGSCELVETMVRLAELFLEEGEVLHDCSSIDDIASAHTIHFCLIFGGLSSLDNIFSTNHLALAKSVHISIARSEMHADLLASSFAASKNFKDLFIWEDIDLLARKVLSHMFDL